MRKNLTEIVFILDRSGSMSGLEQDTIGGFNSMINQQKNADGEALVSTILFDNVSEVLHDRINVKDIQPLTDHDYMVRGCTALLDAIGGAIHHIGNIHKYARREDIPEHTMFVITTDDTISRHKTRKEYAKQKTRDFLRFVSLLIFSILPRNEIVSGSNGIRMNRIPLLYQILYRHIEG